MRKPILSIALVLFLLVSLFPAFSAAEETKGSMECETLNLSLFQIDDRTAKVSVYNLADAFSVLNPDAANRKYTYRYSLKMMAPGGVEIFGRITYKPGDSSSYWKVSSMMTCKQRRSDDQVHAYITGDGTVNWQVKLNDFCAKNFAFTDTTEFVLTVSMVKDSGGRADAAESIVKAYQPETVFTEELLRVKQKRVDGLLRVEVPDDKTLRVFIDDPALQTDYKVSPGGKGTKTAKWQIKAVINSYLWAMATVDGSRASSLDDMQFYAGEFHLDQYETNKYSPTTFAVTDASYSIDGDTVIIEMHLSDDLEHNFRNLKYIQLATKDRDIFTKYQIGYY